MNTPLTADDVVVGIFYHLQTKKKNTITADRERLHKVFFELKKTKPHTMACFSFRDRGQFPESPELDQAISNLDATGLISRYNVSPRYYQFETALTDNYMHFSKEVLRVAGISEADLTSAAIKMKPQLAKGPA